MLTAEIDADLRLLEIKWNGDPQIRRRLRGQEIRGGIPRVYVPTEVSAFLIAIARESLLYREEEWEAELGPDLFASPRTLNEFREQIMELVDSACRRVLIDASEIALGRHRQGDGRPSALRSDVPAMLLIDVLQAIGMRWCNIWPFCRPTPGS